MNRLETGNRKVVFAEKMNWLQDNLQYMGSLVEEAIGRSIEALKNQDMVSKP